VAISKLFKVDFTEPREQLLRGSAISYSQQPQVKDMKEKAGTKERSK
jgi:hypothetical protein